MLRITLPGNGWFPWKPGSRRFRRVAESTASSAPETAGRTAAGRWDRDGFASPFSASSPENKAGGFGQKIAFHHQFADLPSRACKHALPGDGTCSFSTSFCEIGGSSSAFTPNADAMFEIAIFFQPLIIVGWTPCFLASSAVVSSSRIASRATLALNSAE
jgi:hypothetical protein